MFALQIKSQIRELLTYIIDVNVIQQNRNFSNDEIKPIKMSFKVYDKLSPPLIILHGLLGSKANWSSKCTAYTVKTSPPRRVIAADIRNHGESPHTDIHNYPQIVADLKALVDKLALKKTALMGHSMGGRACMLFSLKYPEVVERLIVADISPIAGLHMAEFSKIFDILLSLKMPTDVPLSTALKMVDTELKPKIPNGIFRAFLLANVTRGKDGSYSWRINLPVLKKDLDNVSRFPLDDAMKYEGPTLFVAGSKSNFVPKADFPKILKYFPKAELTYIDGATHMLHHDKPQEFMDITLEFLNRIIR